MFKNYLTYQFAVSFHRSCGLLEISPPKRDRLMRSATLMLNEFSQAVRATDPKDEFKHLCVTLICLRDCQETLNELGAELGKALGKEVNVWPTALRAEFNVLHGRMEQICLKASEAQGGQLWMFG